MATIMALLPADNDENVTIVLRMLTELHKTFRQRKSDSVAAAAAAVVDDGQPPMEQHVGPYLEFVKKVGTHILHWQKCEVWQLLVHGHASAETLACQGIRQPALSSWICVLLVQVFENLPVTYNELFVDGLAKPEEAVAKLDFQPAHKSIKVAIDCPVVGETSEKSVFPIIA